MKKINKFLGLGLGVVAAFSLASCSNDVNEPNNTPNNEDVVLNLVKTPDVIAWTGSQTLLNTKGTRGTYVENGKKYYTHDNEVEVNLSILDSHDKYEIADLAAKLSIHVRNANDVKVTIPIPAEYIIDSDDLAIFNKHESLGISGYLSKVEDNEHQVKVTVGGRDVKLTVSFADEATDPLTGKPMGEVTVTTDGINDEVMAALFGEGSEHDGLNFEVYIYIAENEEEEQELTAETLKESKVEFLLDDEQEAPLYYINAFGLAYDQNGNKTEDVNPKDCIVSLQESESYVYEKVGDEMNHLNGSSHNVIYILENETPDHAHGGAVEVPDQGKDSPNGEGTGTGGDTVED